MSNEKQDYETALRLMSFVGKTAETTPSTPALTDLDVLVASVYAEAHDTSWDQLTEEDEPALARIKEQVGLFVVPREERAREEGRAEVRAERGRERQRRMELAEAYWNLLLDRETQKARAQAAEEQVARLRAEVTQPRSKRLSKLTTERDELRAEVEAIWGKVIPVADTVRDEHRKVEADDQFPAHCELCFNDDSYLGEWPCDAVALADYVIAAATKTTKIKESTDE